MTLVDMFVIALEDKTSTGGNIYGPYAAECILEFCVQELSAIVLEGAFKETIRGRSAAGSNRLTETS